VRLFFIPRQDIFPGELPVSRMVSAIHNTCLPNEYDYVTNHSKKGGNMKKALTILVSLVVLLTLVITSCTTTEEPAGERISRKQSHKRLPIRGNRAHTRSF
jgi:predicted small secreted protein